MVFQGGKGNAISASAARLGDTDADVRGHAAATLVDVGSLDSDARKAAVPCRVREVGMTYQKCKWRILTGNDIGQDTSIYMSAIVVLRLLR